MTSSSSDMSSRPGQASTHLIASRAVFTFRSFQQGVDGHRMAVTQLKIVFQPFNDGSRFHAIRESTVVCESLFLGERPEVRGSFPGLGLNVRKVGLV